MVPVSLVLLITLALTDNMLSSAALLDNNPLVVPVAETALTWAVTVSVVLMSRTDSVPLLVSVVLVSVNESAELSPGSTVMLGAELLPLIVMTTSWVSVAPWLSVVVIV